MKGSVITVPVKGTACYTCGTPQCHNASLGDVLCYVNWQESYKKSNQAGYKLAKVSTIIMHSNSTVAPYAFGPADVTTVSLECMWLSMSWQGRHRPENSGTVRLMIT